MVENSVSTYYSWTDNPNRMVQKSWGGINLMKRAWIKYLALDSFPVSELRDAD